MCLYIPPSNGVSSQCYLLAIRTKHQTSICTFVSYQKVTQNRDIVQVPQNDRFISTCGCKIFAILAECNLGHSIFVTPKRLPYNLTRLHVPKDNCPICAP